MWDNAGQLGGNVSCPTGSCSPVVLNQDMDLIAFRITTQVPAVPGGAHLGVRHFTRPFAFFRVSRIWACGLKPDGEEPDSWLGIVVHYFNPSTQSPGSLGIRGQPGVLQ